MVLPGSEDTEAHKAAATEEGKTVIAKAPTMADIHGLDCIFLYVFLRQRLICRSGWHRISYVTQCGVQLITSFLFQPLRTGITGSSCYA